MIEKKENTRTHTHAQTHLSCNGFEEHCAYDPKEHNHEDHSILPLTANNKRLRENKKKII